MKRILLIINGLLLVTGCFAGNAGNQRQQQWQKFMSAFRQQSIGKSSFVLLPDKDRWTSDTLTHEQGQVFIPNFCRANTYACGQRVMYPRYVVLHYVCVSRSAWGWLPSIDWNIATYTHSGQLIDHRTVARCDATTRCSLRGEINPYTLQSEVYSFTEEELFQAKNPIACQRSVTSFAIDDRGKISERQVVVNKSEKLPLNSIEFDLLTPSLSSP